MAGASALKVDYKPHVSLKETVKVSTRTGDFILEEQKVDKLDILSIDVEGSEIHVLQGIDLNKWLPKIIVIENIRNTKNQEDYLFNYNYRKINRIGFNDFYKKNNM